MSDSVPEPDSDQPTMAELRERIRAQYDFGSQLHPRDTAMLRQAQSLSLGLPLYLQGALADEDEDGP